MDPFVEILRSHWLQLATGFLLPLAVGWATKLNAHPFVESAVNFGLSVVAGALEAIAVNGGAVDPEQIVAYVLAIFATSHLAYKAVWKPAGGGKADPVRLVTPDVGLSGPPAPLPQR